MVQKDNGTKRQRENGTIVQWYKGTIGQWDNGTLGQWDKGKQDKGTMVGAMGQRDNGWGNVVELVSGGSVINWAYPV